MALKRCSGSNYKTRTKSFPELLEMVREIVGKARLLNKELAKLTELDMQKMVAARKKVNTKSLLKASEDMEFLEELLSSGGHFTNQEYYDTLAAQLGRFVCVVGAEYDSKFIGVEK